MTSTAVTPTGLMHLGMAAKDASYLDTSVTQGVKYYYAIKVTNIYGTEGQVSALSEARTNLLAIPPTTPQNLNALIDDSSNIRLTWSPPESGSESVEGYLIYRSENVEELTLVDKISQKSNEYVDRTAKPGVKYAYKVSAMNSSGESARSIAVTQKVLPAPPGVNLSVESRDGSIILRWDLLIPTTRSLSTSYTEVIQQILLPTAYMC